MTIQSAKAKGRRLAQEVRDVFLRWAPLLADDDIFITPSSVPGEDLKMSACARAVYPYSIECKNQEKLNLWKAIEQSESHAAATEYTPILIFSRNRSSRYVVIGLEKFMELNRKGAGNEYSRTT